MPNGRCKLHGGASTGVPKGNKNSLKHGIYSKTLRGDEVELWHKININGVDDELRIAKIQLMRALKAQGLVFDNPDGEDGFYLSELKTEARARRGGARAGGENAAHKTTVRKRPDYWDQIYRLLGRIGHLHQVRASLPNSDGKTPGQLAADIKAALDEIETLTGGVDDGDGPGPAVDAS